MKKIIKSDRDYRDIIIKNLLEPLIIIDENKKIIFSNQIYSEISGYSQEELEGKTYTELLDEKYKNINITMLPLTEIVHTGKNGRKIEFLSKSVPLPEINNNKGYACILKDITERKARQKELEANSEKISQFAKHLSRAHDQLLDAKISAEAANKAKSMFLANMSHELRSPLGSIIGFSEIISEEEELPPEEIKDMAGIILKCGRNLLDLLNEILDLSKIEAGKIVVERRKFELEEMLLNTLSILQVKAKAKNITLKYEFDNNLPSDIITDEARLRQILVNLMGNAIKFTDEGYVKLSCRPYKEDDFALFSVIDTGIGIEPDKLKSIFEPFVQAEKATTRKYGGTGLGLTITEKLTILLGGEIWVESEPGKGTTFNFTLPLTATPGEDVILQGEIGEKEILPEDIIEQPEKKEKKVKNEVNGLICDDDRESCSIVSKYLSDAGYTVSVVNTGRDAIEAFKSKNIDFILMDIRMPGMTGIEAAKKIRELPGGSGIPIIACTASVLEGDLEEFVDAGFDDYMMKPVDRNELLNLISKFI